MSFTRFIFTSVTIVTLALSVTSDSLQAQSKEVIAEYFKLLKDVNPRDAEAHFVLANWCGQNGMTSKKQKLLERTILIDPDHASARDALGYTRHGLGWRLGSGKASNVKKTEVVDDDETSKSEATEVENPDDPDSAGKKTPQQLIQEKLAFAAKAEKTLGIKFNTYQDKDFIIHSSHKANSKQVKSLLANLRRAKGLAQKLIGIKSSVEIWPDRLQFFYLKQLECESFSELLLSRRFINTQDFEPIHDRAVLFHSFPDDELTRFVGKSVLTRLGGSDNFVSGWLSSGIAELMVTQTTEGKKNKVYQKAFEIVGRQIDDDPQAYLLREVLEEVEPDSKNLRLGRSMSMTLVDFMVRTSRRNFGKFVTDLKEGSKSPPPESQDSPEFRKFLLQYLTRQESLIEKSFRMDPEKFEARWKLHVMNERKKFKGAEDENEAKTNRRGGNRGGTTTNRGGNNRGGNRGGTTRGGNNRNRNRNN